MFQDWLYQDMTDFESALEYECEHPSWQYEWGSIKDTEFPALTISLEAEFGDMV